MSTEVIHFLPLMSQISTSEKHSNKSDSTMPLQDQEQQSVIADNVPQTTSQVHDVR